MGWWVLGWWVGEGWWERGSGRGGSSFQQGIKGSEGLHGMVGPGVVGE